MKTFIIAEIGINHNGSLEIAKNMIGLSKWAGADAVKFQLYDAEKLLGKESPYYDCAKKSTFLKKDYIRLKEYADKTGIEFMCSVFHNEDIGFVDKLVKRHKIASRISKNDLGILKKVYSLGKEVIISTGLLNKLEIADLQRDFKEGRYLYCVCKYPSKPSDINLKEGLIGMDGFSSHCPDPIPTIKAVALGATIVENHVTLSRHLEGCDQSSSLEFQEFREMVDTIRKMEMVR